MLFSKRKKPYKKKDFIPRKKRIEYQNSLENDTWFRLKEFFRKQKNKLRHRVQRSNKDLKQKLKDIKKKFFLIIDIIIFVKFISILLYF